MYGHQARQDICEIERERSHHAKRESAWRQLKGKRMWGVHEKNAGLDAKGCKRDVLSNETLLLVHS